MGKEKKNDSDFNGPRPRIDIIATPIGNLQDFSPRARLAISSADLILCEDTRQLRKLLTAAGLKAKAWQAYHAHNESAVAHQVIERALQEKLVIAVVSDAGTPAISDPGFCITSLAHAHGIPVSPIPGPSAPLALLSASGLPADRFYFCGFLPRKKSLLRDCIGRWGMFGCTVLFLETAPRIAESLQALAARYPGTIIAIGRELTKLHEDIRVMPVETALATIEAGGLPLKGEFCVAAAIKAETIDEDESDEALALTIQRLLHSGNSLKSVVRQLTDSGFSKGRVYALALEAKAALLQQEEQADNDDDSSGGSPG